MTVSDRYEIQEILFQGPEGVCFLVVDRQADREVALQRFFPFGPEGGGFGDDDAQTFRAGLARLMEIERPGLRRVIDGGVDGHDGIPFLVTEPIPRATVAAGLARGSFGPGLSRALAVAVLDVCLGLSRDFGEERVWIDTSPEAVGFDESGEEPSISLGISAGRWLGDGAGREGLRPVAELLGAVADRSGSVGDEAFDEWLRLLRENSGGWTLAAARAALDAPHSRAVAATARGSAAVRGPGPPAAKSSRTRWPWVAAASVAVLATLAFGLLAGSGRESAPPESAAAPPEPPPAPAGAAERVSARAAELTAERARASDPPPVPLGPASPEKNAELIELGARLREKTGERFSFETTVYQIRPSNSGKTLYVEFGSSADPDALLARHRVSHGGFTFAELEGFIGREVRVEGEIVNDPSGRVALDLVDPSDLRALAE